MQPDDLWLGDRNFCVRSFLCGICDRQAYFIIRQHGNLPFESLGKEIAKGRTDTGKVFEQPICVFDEWAAGQDTNFKKIFYEEFLPEMRSRGKLIIASSHDDAYFSTADRLIKLDYGKIKFDKAPSY